MTIILILILNSVQEEEQVALPHDISSKLPLTSDKNGTQVSYYVYSYLYIIQCIPLNIS